MWSPHQPFTALVLATAPLQRSASARLAPAPIAPNLAAIGYDTSCPAMFDAAGCSRYEADYGNLGAAGLSQAHQEMMRHTGHSAEAHAAMNAPFDGRDKRLGPDTAAASCLSCASAPALDSRRGHHPVGRRRQLRPLFRHGTGGRRRAVSVPLRLPPVLPGSRVTIQMREADVRVMPSGSPTRKWAYNGSYPGPTIRRPSAKPAGSPSATTYARCRHSRTGEGPVVRAPGRPRRRR